MYKPNKLVKDKFAAVQNAGVTVQRGALNPWELRAGAPVLQRVRVRELRSGLRVALRSRRWPVREVLARSVAGIHCHEAQRLGALQEWGTSNRQAG